MSTLVKGCTISIPLSKKAALDTEVPDGDPQRMTDYLLDCLLPLEEQAQMTCDGKTEGTKALPDKMRTCLQVYVKAKYNAKKFNFTVPLFKTWVNGKFYKARNWVRKYRPDLVEKGLVRPKMEKNMKKKSENEGDNKEEGSSSNKGEKSGNSSTKHVSQDSPKKPKPLKGSKSKTNTTQVSSDNGKRKHIKIDRKGYGRHKESDHTMSSRKRNIKESEKRHDSGKKKKSYKKRNDEDDISEKESNDRKRSIKKRNVEDDTSERESNDRKSSVKKRNNRDDDVNRRELDGRSRNSKRRNDGNENDYSMTKKSRNNDYESEGEERESDRKGTNTKRSDNGEEDDHRINKKRSDKDNEREFKEGRETCKKRNETAFEKNSNEERKRPGSDNHPDKGGKCPKSSILSETERKINELKFKTSTPKEKTKSGRKNPDDVDGSKFNEYISSTESSPIQSQHEDLSESDSDSNSLLATRSPVSESGASQSEIDSD